MGWCRQLQGGQLGGGGCNPGWVAMAAPGWWPWRWPAVSDTGDSWRCRDLASGSCPQTLCMLKGGWGLGGLLSSSRSQAASESFAPPESSPILPHWVRCPINTVTCVTPSLSPACALALGVEAAGLGLHAPTLQPPASAGLACRRPLGIQPAAPLSPPGLGLDAVCTQVQ